MSEEINRVVTDRLSDLLFAFSDERRPTCGPEGYRDDPIHVVGNAGTTPSWPTSSGARQGDVLHRLGLSG